MFVVVFDYDWSSRPSSSCGALLLVVGFDILMAELQ